MGNKGVTLASNVLFDSYISDMETGYKMLRSEPTERLNLKGTRFDIEPDIAARVLRLGYRIHEVPIRYYARSCEEDKKLTWMDGLPRSAPWSSCGWPRTAGCSEQTTTALTMRHVTRSLPAHTR